MQYKEYDTWTEWEADLDLQGRLQSGYEKPTDVWADMEEMERLATWAESLSNSELISELKADRVLKTEDSWHLPLYEEELRSRRERKLLSTWDLLKLPVDILIK